MRSKLTVSLLGAATLAAAMLAACGGGGSSHGSVLSAAPTSAPASGSNGNGLSGPTAKIVLVIPRHTAQAPPKFNTGHLRHGAATLRSPKYLGNATQGIQVAVSGGGTTKTVYADASSSSTLCTTTNNLETCTFTVPVVAATETLMVDDVDVLPTDDGTNGNPAGYGSGFTGGHVLAAGTTPANLTAGQTTAIALKLGAVLGGLGDCGTWNASSEVGYENTAPDETPGTNPDGNTDVGPLGRIVFTAGTSAWVEMVPVPTDYDGSSATFASPSPAFVDVNASPESVVATSQLSHVSLYASAASAVDDNPPPVPPAASSFGASASLVDQSYIWLYSYFPVIYVEYDGQPSAGGTISFTNNLSATDLFGNPSYGWSEPYTVAFVGASPTALTLSTNPLSSNHTGTVTGSDFQAAYQGMEAGSAAGSNNGNCNAGTTTLATITAGAMNTTTWTQTFTVTASALGTCNFYLSDTETDQPSQVVQVSIPN
jgi:hypothetical protein